MMFFSFFLLTGRGWGSVHWGVCRVERDGRDVSRGVRR